MTKRRKIRIRWGRLSIVIGVFILMIFGIVMLIKGCVSLFSDDKNTDRNTNNNIINVTPEMLYRDSVMAHRIDSLMHIPQRLDTSMIAISVFDATSGMSVYRRHATDTLAPASCMKVLTALAALKRLGYDHRYYESLQIRGKIKGDTLKGNLLLRADADPLLEDFNGLVKQLHRTGIRHIDGNIYLHLAKEDTLRPHPTAKTWDLPYHKLPPLLKGKRFIHRTLLYTLQVNGISFKRNKSIKPEGKYRVVAQSSHLLRDVLSPMIIHSSNIKADAVFYHMDWKAGLLPSNRQRWNIRHDAEEWISETFAEDSAMVKSFTINDGSGLSPYNRLNADFLVKLMRYAYNDDKIREYFINEALATPGNGERRGSLLTRLSNREYVNRIFVKTGTLTTIGTSSLTGFIHGKDNHWYIFSIINSDSPVAESRIFQDRLCKVMMK